jgi:hypothetical protein
VQVGSGLEGALKAWGLSIAGKSYSGIGIGFGGKVSTSNQKRINIDVCLIRYLENRKMSLKRGYYWCLGSEQEHACFYPWNPHDYVELMEV